MPYYPRRRYRRYRRRSGLSYLNRLHRLPVYDSSSSTKLIRLTDWIEGYASVLDNLIPNRTLLQGITDPRLNLYGTDIASDPPGSWTVPGSWHRFRQHYGAGYVVACKITIRVEMNQSEVVTALPDRDDTLVLQVIPMSARMSTTMTDDWNRLRCFPQCKTIEVVPSKDSRSRGKITYWATPKFLTGTSDFDDGTIFNNSVFTLDTEYDSRYFFAIFFSRKFSSGLEEVIVPGYRWNCVTDWYVRASAPEMTGNFD